MKATTFGKAGVSLTAALALSIGVTSGAFAATPPTATQEDPTTATANGQLVGVGSDTIQDVLYGLSQSIPAIQSWTATGGANITYRSGLTIARPNGSGPGYKALTDSIGLTAAGNAKAGDVDFARASGTQGTAATTAGTGITTDIPFAIDSISLAVPANSPFLKTNSGHGLTVTDLYNIYAGAKNEISTDGNGTLGRAEALDGTPDAGYEAIQAFLPKAGSGSRQFFLGQISGQGGSSTGIPLGTNKGDSYGSTTTPVAGKAYIGSKTPAGTDVQEHDATVLTSTANTVAAIAPFSGAKYIGYANGKIADPDTTNNSGAGTSYQLVPFDSTVSGAPVGGVLPFTGTGANLAPNPAYQTYATKGTEASSFALTRQVYNIIPTAAVKGAGTSTNAKYNLLYKTFVGPTSDVCKATSTITGYGFLAMPTTGSGTLCGDTSKTFDATPSTATVNVSSTKATAGGSSKVTVDVQSNGNGGGTAALSIEGKTYTVTIPAGATSGTVSVPTPTAGTLTYTGSFTPNLAGVAPQEITAGSIVVAAAPAPPVTVKPSITSVKITGKAKVGKKLKAAVVATTAGQKVSYQWMVKSKKIAGATKSSLKLTKKFKGKKIKVMVTLAGVSKTSAAVKVK
ncbi:hypothetical protein P5P86_05730 [Nocardioides sp. BP30]|uniref:hypothetical protein n=1 Tax=Nocardioides sp. BP30 TaxID=3036374 RepID=UPI0024694017|nr:hypothetical protein [Nocardioides sp. BP30]WGL53326.1 hypothetical protein P5P86_05730 [Nocardioides sp. BP30]